MLVSGSVGCPVRLGITLFPLGRLTATRLGTADRLLNGRCRVRPTSSVPVTGRLLRPAPPAWTTRGCCLIISQPRPPSISQLSRHSSCHHTSPSLSSFCGCLFHPPHSINCISLPSNLLRIPVSSFHQPKRVLSSLSDRNSPSFHHHEIQVQGRASFREAQGRGRAYPPEICRPHPGTCSVWSLGSFYYRTVSFIGHTAYRPVPDPWASEELMLILAVPYR
jgi:hypothetical protein